MKKYDLSGIMKAAWGIFRKGVATFAVALRMAWANAKTHNTAKSRRWDHRGNPHMVWLEAAGL